MKCLLKPLRLFGDAFFYSRELILYPPKRCGQLLRCNKKSRCKFTSFVLHNSDRIQNAFQPLSGVHHFGPQHVTQSSSLVSESPVQARQPKLCLTQTDVRSCLESVTQSSSLVGESPVQVRQPKLCLTQTDLCFGVKRVSQCTSLVGENPVQVRQPKLCLTQTDLRFGVKRVSQCTSLVGENPFRSCQHVLCPMQTDLCSG